MAERFSGNLILRLCLCGFVYKLGATFAVLLSFSSFLKIAGRAALPEYYVWLSLATLLTGVVMTGSQRWQQTGLRASRFVAPAFALMLWAAGSYYAVLARQHLLLLYVAVSLYDVYLGIIFWNTANSLLTVREMRQWVGVIAGVMFSGGIILGFLMPLLFSFASFQTWYPVCGIIFLLLPLCVAALPQVKDGISAPLPVEEPRWQASLSQAAAHPLSAFIVGSMVVLAFARYSTSFLFASALSQRFADERDFASFSGAFESLLRLLSLVSQSLLLPWLLRYFRPTTLLLLTPVVLMAGSALLLVLPGFMGLVLFQFILLLSIRTFDQNLVNLFLNLYDRALRNRFRFFSDGIVFASAVIVTGFLLKYVAASGNETILPWLLLAAGCGYWLLARRAADRYRLALQASIGVNLYQHSAGENMPVFDHEAEMSRILAQPIRSWPHLIGRLTRQNQAVAATLIDMLLARSTSEAEKSLLTRIAGRNGHCQLEPVLVRLLADECSPRVLADCIEAVYRLMGKRAMPFIKPFIDHSDNRVAGNAVLAMVRLADTAKELHPVLACLLKMASSENAGCRATAAAMLGELPHRCFSELLRRLLFDQEAKVRAAAAKSCVKWRSHELIVWLTECADRFPEDREQLVAAVSSLQNGMMTRLDSMASELGVRSQVGALLGMRRERAYVELLLRLLMHGKVDASLKLAETLIGHEHCACLQKISACLADGSVAVEKICHLADSGCDDRHEGEVIQEFFECLRASDLLLVGEQILLRRSGGAVRRALFIAAGHDCGIQSPGNVWAGLLSQNQSEKDLACELLDNVKGQLASLLKRLAGCSG